MDDFSEKIIDLLEARKTDGMRKTEIRRHLNIRSENEMDAFREGFRQLLTNGAVIKQNRGRYVLASAAELIKGTISVHRRGFGFVKPDDNGSDIFIPPKNMGTAISGDRVLVAVTEKENERGPAGSVMKIVERPHEFTTGTLVENQHGFFVRPLRPGLPERLPLDDVLNSEGNPKADLGDWIVVQLQNQKHRLDPLRATFVRMLSTANTITGDLDAIVNEFSLEMPYSKEEDQAAANLEPLAIERDDIQDLVVVTVDPTDAKDFDDAVSLQTTDRKDRVILGVHIADVAAYVQTGTPLDQAAHKRAFTAYLPGRTLTMLPRTLSASNCSLIMCEPRAAHSVFMEVSTENGAVLRAWRKHTMIKVTQRLTFDQVQSFLATGHKESHWSQDVAKVLSGLGNLYKLMRDRRRQEEEFLELHVPEVRVMASENPPQIRGLKRVEPNEAHELVEEFMLAANNAVAEELQKRNIPGMYRVHADPDPGDIAEFIQWTTQVLDANVKKLKNRKAINRFFMNLKNSPLHDVVISNFLRVMQRALYSEECSSHYGLGKEKYSHFTSPIRRYTDLVVHQQLLAFDSGGKLRSKEECKEIAAHCSEREENNDAAYYAASDRLKLRYLRDRMEVEGAIAHEGIIAKINADGLVIFLPDYSLYGNLSRQLLPGGHYRYDRQTASLKSAASQKSYQCGKFIYVHIRHADLVKGRLELEPARLAVAGKPE